MIERAIVDAGPLVAVFNEKEPTHAWARDRLYRFARPLLTCEPVLTEAFFLLRRARRGDSGLMDLLARRLVVLPFRLEPELVPILALMRKYADVPMSLADACLVRIAELDPRATVFTLDSDFRRYRTSRGRALRLLVPPARA